MSAVKNSQLKDEVTENKVRKHYSDQNDKITDEDIANAASNFNSNGAVEEIPIPKEHRGTPIDGVNSGSIQSVWNVASDSK